MSMRTSLAIAVRLAGAADAQRIAQLAGQLGYPSTAAEMTRRLAEISDDRDHAVFAAEANGMVVGWIHVAVSRTLLVDDEVLIAGLVTDENHRSRGVGRLLMKTAEQWARDRGCCATRVRSQIARARAHAFYEALGYAVIKTQKVFRKDLA